MTIKRNPKLRLLYLTMLLPITAGVMSILLARHAFQQSVLSTMIADLVLAGVAAGVAVKCWGVTFEWVRNMRQFIEANQAIKRGELVLLSTVRSGLPEIAELAQEIRQSDESPDTALAKWILLSNDHQAIFVRLVEAMAAALDTKNFYTRGHSGRVAEYSTLISHELGLSPEESSRIRISALLHDIGKIGMDQTILTKASALTSAEFKILKTHPARGVEMLRPVPQLVDVLPGVELHHEALDGSGYPHGLRGEEIPLMARIIAVADTFDAMTHNRTYQEALDGAYALRVIRNMAGRKFDERAVAAFCRVYDQGLILLPVREKTADPEREHSAVPA